MVLLARTTDLDKVAKKTEGLSTFLIDVKAAQGNGLDIRPIESMINHHSCELFFDDLEIPADNLLGEEGKGFKVILDGMNAERVLIAAECVGDGRYFIDKASAYASERVVFNRPIGANQGVQFPIARAYTQVEAAALMVEKAAQMFDQGLTLRSRGEYGKDACVQKPLGPLGMCVCKPTGASRLQRNTISNANFAKPAFIK